jgi:molecular chaperone GrpE (heat shock protein)
MTQKPPESKVTTTAADIERSIQALNKMAERLWGDGRESEAKALLDALDALNRALDRVRIGESRRVLH